MEHRHHHYLCIIINHHPHLSMLINQLIKQKIYVQDKRMFIGIVNVRVKESIRTPSVVIRESVFVIIIVDSPVSRDVIQEELCDLYKSRFMFSLSF